MGRGPARRPTLWIAVAIALLATGCGRTGSDRTAPPDATATTTPGAPATGGGPADQSSGATVPPLDWKHCDGPFECATLAAPLDYSDPKGATIDVAVVRHPATDEKDRIGALFFNPGGPGGSAIDLAEGISEALPTSITDHFDIVGVDPRGVGRSTSLDCDQDVPAMYAVDPTIEDAGDRRALLRASQRFVDRCEAEDGPLLDHMGTRDVARDMDLVRAAMGDEQISYFGYSYGTALGQVYAELFPQRVRAMVLDGVVDIGQSGIEGARLQGDGFEQALEAFVRDCGDDPGCPLRPDAMAVVDRVMAAAERAPIPAEDADRGAGPAEVTFGMVYALYQEGRWPDLEQALAEADGTDPNASRLVGLADSYLNEAQFAPYFAVNCLDASWPKADALLAAAKANAKSSPHFGEAVTTDYVRCSLWPAAPQPLTPLSRTGLAGVAPVVLVSTTGDPATPYASGVDAARSFPEGRLVTVEGTRHTGAFHGDPCVDEPVTTYLVDLTLPRAGLRC